MKRDLDKEKFELISDNQDLRFKVWGLERMVSGLLSALNESESMRKKKENQELPRV